jgi:hypothetical protein
MLSKTMIVINMKYSFFNGVVICERVKDYKYYMLSGPD